MSHLDYLDLQAIDTEHGTVGVGIGVTTTGLYRLGIAIDATDRIDIHLNAVQARAAIDDMEPVWGTQDTIWAGETPGQRKRRRATGGTVHRARRVHVTAGPESGDWLTTRIPNARRKVRI